MSDPPAIITDGKYTIIFYVGILSVQATKSIVVLIYILV